MIRLEEAERARRIECAGDRLRIGFGCSTTNFVDRLSLQATIRSGEPRAGPA